MKRIVFCVFYKKNLEGMDKVPYPGKLGKKIYKKISKKAWLKWMNYQTIVINEKKLNMFDPKDQIKIIKFMNIFLFKK
ncbi:oxidative damage protection protein [Buchnera aphidicola]|uniref:Oxidative damage protection protein n=1 Tax=Buchnera aphidicola (Anoecia oenotherae) TaxID=1241833 RepID=A0A4D6XYN7_9GAMM|nr:oxidative damage protection protein [Buchnera aphidicola]QCI19588.1 oxidative damage protection protein [Buchnera aphidicola (Anoecia oenotherae)]